MFNLIPFRRNTSVSFPDVFGIERFFEDFFQDPFFPVIRPELGTMKVDIKDTETAYVLEADLPGLKKEDLRLEFENDRLTIAVERDEQFKAEKENYLRQERRWSSMSRTFVFENVNHEQISAEYENGVLKVTLPKRESKPRAKRIKIS